MRRRERRCETCGWPMVRIEPDMPLTVGDTVEFNNGWRTENDPIMAVGIVIEDRGDLLAVRVSEEWVTYKPRWAFTRKAP